MSKHIQITPVAVAAALAILAGAARAQNSEAGGGPFEPGAPSTLYLTAPGNASEAGTTPPAAQRDLGAPALVFIGGSEDSATNDAARDEAWLAARDSERKQASAAGAAAGAH